MSFTFRPGGSSEIRRYAGGRRNGFSVIPRGAKRAKLALHAIVWIERAASRRAEGVVDDNH